MRNGLLVLADVSGAVDEAAVSGDVNADVKDGKPHLTGAPALDAISTSTRLAAMVLGEASAGKRRAMANGRPSPFQQKAAAPFTADLDDYGSHAFGRRVCAGL